MRILHTSDWHLGASLEGVSRDDDHARFLAWLGTTLAEERIDVLIVAGDVFDQAHPSSEAQRRYFGFLRDVSRIETLRQVVIVGGNHDSASFLDAPRGVLEALSVHVVGGLASDRATWERAIVPVSNRDGAVELVVLAVPFVHEFRLGVRTAGVEASDIQRDFQAAFAGLYTELADRAEAAHPGAPLIATGHLACVGTEKSDAPYEIHLVGTLGGLPSSIFDPRLRYVALGHIHKRYRVGESAAHYAGTPVALSLREAVVPRSVQVIDVEGGEARVSKRDVPAFRDLIELRGELAEVLARLRALSWTNELPPIVFANVEVDRYGGGVEAEVRAALEGRGERAPIVAAVRQTPRSSSSHPGDARVPALHELTAEQVFLRLCGERGVAIDDALLQAFRAVLTSSNDDDEAAR